MKRVRTITVWLRRWIVSLLFVAMVACDVCGGGGVAASYEIGCIYPERMLEPFAARAKLIGFTSVYAGSRSANGGRPLETPVGVHQGQAFSYCDVNCLAHHDEHTLNAFTMSRPSLVVPEFGQNSWSRMMCLAQCYAILFAREGNIDAVDTIVNTWKLGIRSEVEPAIADHFETNYAKVSQYIEEEGIGYDPLVIGRLVVHEIGIHLPLDGWNADGSMRYDVETDQTVPCSHNCIPYRDTYGYFTRNHPQGHGQGQCDYNNITTTENENENASNTQCSKYNVTGNDRFWQPLLEDDGNGYLSRQEHVTPHIGFHAKTVLLKGEKYERKKDGSYSSLLKDPEYDFYNEALLVVDRVRESARSRTKWDKISFYDKKFLVRLLLQDEMLEQFGSLGLYRFEDELLFVHGISAAEHDSVILSWREKVIHDLVRPTTVIQRWGGDELTTFQGNRDQPNVSKINAHDFRAFARVMPHSEYPSGSACICTSYHEFTDAFTSFYFDQNLTDMFWGYGGIDYGCSELSVIDPARAAFLGCAQGGFSIANAEAMARECGASRLWGGMHFTDSVPAGHELCRGIGKLGFDHSEAIRNGSDYSGNTHVKGGQRPRCTTKAAEKPLPTLVDVDDGASSVAPPVIVGGTNTDGTSNVFSDAMESSVQLKYLLQQISEEKDSYGRTETIPTHNSGSNTIKQGKSSRQTSLFLLAIPLLSTIFL